MSLYTLLISHLPEGEAGKVTKKDLPRLPGPVWAEVEQDKGTSPNLWPQDNTASHGATVATRQPPGPSVLVAVKISKRVVAMSWLSRQKHPWLYKLKIIWRREEGIFGLFRKFADFLHQFFQFQRDFAGWALPLAVTFTSNLKRRHRVENGHTILLLN